MEGSDDEASPRLPQDEKCPSSADLHVPIREVTNRDTVKENVRKQEGVPVEQEHGIQTASEQDNAGKIPGDARSQKDYDATGGAQNSSDAEIQEANNLSSNKELPDSSYDRQILGNDESNDQKKETVADKVCLEGENIQNPISDEHTEEGSSVTDAESESLETTFKALNFSSIRGKPLTNEQVLGLIELQKETGQFSYYILDGGKVVIHAEDDKSRKSQDYLKSSFLNVTGGNSEDVEVTASSFGGSFCCNRIGARLQVYGRDQTVGMYVSHRNLLHWVSSAHNVFLTEEANTRRVEVDRKVLYGTEKVQFYVDDQLVPVPIAYCSFARSNAEDREGRRLLHLVDIAIGPVGTFSSLVEVGKPQFTHTLHEAHNPCGYCGKALEDCKTKKHSRQGDSYRFAINKFYDMGVPFCGAFARPLGDTCRYYDDKLIKDGGKLVRCLAPGKPVMAGTIISCDNRVIIYDHQRFEYEALNTVLIVSENPKVTPEDGDSGSMWVTDDTSEALAITVGQGLVQCGPASEKKAWIAALLKPSLEAFCQHHERQFPEGYDFLPAIGKSLSLPEARRPVSPPDAPLPTVFPGLQTSLLSPVSVPDASLLTVVSGLQTSLSMTLQPSDPGYSTRARSENGI